MPRLYLIPGEAPGPVALRRARCVHALRAIQTQHVLQGEQGDVGHAGAGGADQRPGDVAAVAGEVFAQMVAHRFRRSRPPALRGVVVVGAGIDHGVVGVVVRQVGVVAAIVLPPGEVQDAHAGKAEALAQGGDFGGDDAQIFGNDGQGPERFGHRLEQRHARRLHPAAADGRGLVGGDFPAALETAEMIDAHPVHQLEGGAQPRDPPGKPFGLVRRPAVMRVAPALAGGGKIVGRHPGHNGGVAAGVELEQVGPGPYIGAVERNENRHVAHQPHAFVVGVGAQRGPLAEKAPLGEGPEGDALGVPRPCLLQRFGLTLRQRGVPGVPQALAVVLGQRHEQRVVVEPDGVLGLEGGQVGALLRRGGRLEPRCGPAQTFHAIRDDAVELHALVRQSLLRDEIVGFQPAAPVQLGEVDQQHIAGEGRTAHIGRAAQADAAQRQELPDRLSGGMQPVDEVVGRGPEIAAAVRAGQTGEVQQHAAGAGKTGGGRHESGGQNQGRRNQGAHQANQ